MIDAYVCLVSSCYQWCNMWPLQPDSIGRRNKQMKLKKKKASIVVTLIKWMGHRQPWCKRLIRVITRESGGQRLKVLHVG